MKLGESEIPSGTETFDKYESEVRNYCRSFPAVFSKAQGAEVFDENGRRWIDFFAGAGALNYGHNPPFIKERLIEYLQSDGLTHALDFHTTAKRDFIEKFVRVVLGPRGMAYKLQFCGPTGANAVEAALKLARKATGRTQVGAFTGGWHGMTAGCLSVTSRRDHRQGAGVPLANVTMFPYPEGPNKFPQAIEYIERMLKDSHSGLDLPAAFIVEAVQAEGGVYAAGVAFLQRLRALCDLHHILLIVDDVQAGCGRTGSFFSFDEAGIIPDVVCLSKSIGGYGLPMSLVLLKPSIDVWAPGEHTGTFRGNQLAFLAGATALDFWDEGDFGAEIMRKGRLAMTILANELAEFGQRIEVRGKGLLIGVDLAVSGGGEVADQVSRRCFDNGLIVETCGRDGAVLKVMPPLTISDGLVREGLTILTQSMRETI